MTPGSVSKVMVSASPVFAELPVFFGGLGGGGVIWVVTVAVVVLILAETLVLDTSIRWITGSPPGVLQVFYTSLSNFLATLVMFLGLVLYCRWHEASSATVGFWQNLREAGATLNPLNPEGLVLIAFFGAVLCLIVATRHSLSFGRGMLAYLTSRVLFLTLGGSCALFAWLGAKLAQY
jgi:hypothetical protein